MSPGDEEPDDSRDEPRCEEHEPVEKALGFAQVPQGEIDRDECGDQADGRGEKITDPSFQARIPECVSNGYGGASKTDVVRTTQ